MAGLIRPDQGHVYFDNRNFYVLSRNERKDLRREKFSTSGRRWVSGEWRNYIERSGD